MASAPFSNITYNNLCSSCRLSLEQVFLKPEPDKDLESTTYLATYYFGATAIPLIFFTRIQIGRYC